MSVLRILLEPAIDVNMLPKPMVESLGVLSVFTIGI